MPFSFTDIDYTASVDDTDEREVEYREDIQDDRDELAQERLAELEGDVRKLSVKDIQDSVVSTLEAMDDVSDQEYNQDADDYELGF